MIARGAAWSGCIDFWHASSLCGRVALWNALRASAGSDRLQQRRPDRRAAKL
jgi:hypothetical protein